MCAYVYVCVYVCVPRCRVRDDVYSVRGMPELFVFRVGCWVLGFASLLSRCLVYQCVPGAFGLRLVPGMLLFPSYVVWVLFWFSALGLHA